MTTFHLCLLVNAAFGQVEAAPAKTAELPSADAAESVLAEFERDAQKYVITIELSKPARLDLQPRSLLHWGNPARNGEDGAVFVWTRHGRPEVVGSVFTYRDRRGTILRKHAFHSLCEQPVTAEFQSTVIWVPKSPGVTFAPVPQAQPPADNARRRITQMRNLARQFSVQMIDLNEEKSELRLMTQPLLRYQPEEGVAEDGAIFAFAVATDPEALLILEARRQGDELRWEYALARFHFVTLVAHHQDQEVWRAEPDPDLMKTVFGNDPRQREKTYYSVLKAAGK